MATISSLMSLVGSKVAEQQERGISCLARGDFSTPDGVKVMRCAAQKLRTP